MNYRGFLFTRGSASAGIDFQDYFGDSLSSIDNMVDRAPGGRLEVAGGVLRYLHDCNWKMFVENLNDAMHPMVAHESSAGTAKRLWQDAAPDTPKPMVIEQFTPFVNDYDFFDRMGVKLYDNGHSYTGVNFSIHSQYSSVGPYEQAMIAAYGEERSRQILAEARHNTVATLQLSTIKGAIQAIRHATQPLAVDKTVIESWTFRAGRRADAAGTHHDLLASHQRAPTSMVGHDDSHCYRSHIPGLAAGVNDWISLHWGLSAGRGESRRRSLRRDQRGRRGKLTPSRKFMTAGMTED